MSPRRPRARKSWLQRLHDYFLPHARNGHRPHVFRTTSVMALAAFVLVLEAAYLSYVHVIVPKTGFLASVLPGTLTVLTNEDRAALNLGRVSENPLLAKAATLAAEDMAAKGYFSHETPDGKQPWYWLQRVGYAYQYSGQNLAVNFTESKEVEEAWMNSPTHRANIVKPQYTEIGIGVARGTYEGKEATFVVQFFATPLAEAAPAPADTRLVVDTPAPAPNLSITDLAPEAAGEPSSQPAPAPASIAGAQDAVAATEAAALTAASSPSYVLFYILAGVIILALVLLAAGILRHAALPYFEVVGGALVIILIALAALYVNQRETPDVQVPVEAPQAATV